MRWRPQCWLMVLHVAARVVIAGSHGVAGGVGAGGLESGRKCQFCGCGRTSFRFSRGLSGMQEIISGDALCSMVSQILLLTFPRKYTRKSGAGTQNCIVQTLFPEGFPESGPEPALRVSLLPPRRVAAETCRAGSGPLSGKPSGKRFAQCSFVSRLLISLYFYEEK